MMRFALVDVRPAIAHAAGEQMPPQPRDVIAVHIEQHRLLPRINRPTRPRQHDLRRATASHSPKRHAAILEHTFRLKPQQSIKPLRRLHIRDMHKRHQPMHTGSTRLRMQRRTSSSGGVHGASVLGDQRRAFRFEYVAGPRRLLPCSKRATAHRVETALHGRGGQQKTHRPLYAAMGGTAFLSTAAWPPASGCNACLMASFRT